MKILQNRGNGVVRSKKNAFPTNTRVVNAEDIMFGSKLHLIKKYPSGRFRGNPFMETDSVTDKFIITDTKKRTIIALDEMLNDTISDETIELETNDVDID